MTRGLGRNAFDLPVAALAGLAAAVVAFAMPGDLLGQLVSATGLPHLLAAAEPPLGLKARAGIGIAGAAATFGLVYLVLRMLDRAGRTKDAPEAEIEEDMPRLRRRDLHPDAPICRPISATRDFGEPAPPTLEAPEPEPAASFDATDPALDGDEHFSPSWYSALEESLETFDRPDDARLPDVEVSAEVDRPSPEPTAPASLDDLMRRLEQGLQRRRTRHKFAPARHQPSPPQVFPEASDDRLQSAIDSLQRFAARGE